MSERTRTLAVAAFTIVIVGPSLAFNSGPRSQALAVKSLDLGDGRASASEVVKGYKQWTRVNPEAALIPYRISLQCAPPTAEQPKNLKSDPHQYKFIVVYVNDIGRHAMMEEKVPHFPLGSVIVKEKLPGKESSTPELLTVMTKREPGYNPESGDWEYFALDGSGTSVQAQGRLERCQACHIQEKASDYISRNYLPYYIRGKLK